MSATCGSLKALQHLLIITWAHVSIIFASVLKMTKSKDLLSVALKGKAFKPDHSAGNIQPLTNYNNFSSCRILPNMALNDLYNDFSELSKAHLNNLDDCITMQARYLLFLTHGLALPQWAIIYLLLNHIRSTEHSMNINKLRSQRARANVRNNVIQLVAR